MDYEKLDSISKELFNSTFVNTAQNANCISLFVYKNIMTMEEAKELVERTYLEVRRYDKRGANTW